uniref:GCFC domain-containing protein n=1 Tax=Parastrongyloides trichosuri TaxID=131310 RepID=A0A0N4Z731_PARTI
MFRKSKTKRNIRQKETDTTINEEEEEVNIKLSELVTSRKSISSMGSLNVNEGIGARSNILSFKNDEEDDCEELKIRKRNAKKRYEKYKESLNNINSMKPLKANDSQADISIYKNTGGDVTIINDDVDKELIFFDDTNPSNDIVDENEIAKIKAIRKKKMNNAKRYDDGDIIVINDSDDNDSGDTDDGIRKEEDEEDNEKESDDEVDSDISINFEAGQMAKVMNKKQLKEVQYQDKKRKIVMKGIFNSDEMYDAQVPTDDDFENKTYIDINFELSNEKPRTFEEIIEKLNIKGNDLTIKYKSLTKASESFLRDKVINEERIEFINQNKEIKIDRCRKYKELQIFLRNYFEFVNEKIDDIKECEKMFMNTIKERNDRIFSTRTRADMKELLKQFNVSYRNVENIDITTLIILMKEYGELTSLNTVKYDCFDRMTKVNINNITREIEAKLERTFEDANEEFCSIKKIVSKLFQWYEFDQEKFIEKKIYNVIWKVLSPFIRKDIIKWNPSFIELDKDLSTYGWHKDISEIFDEMMGLEDDDIQYFGVLIPSIIDNIIVDKIIDIVKNVWDPFSPGQCKRLACSLETLLGQSLEKEKRGSFSRLHEEIRNKIIKCRREGPEVLCK